MKRRHSIQFNVIFMIHFGVENEQIINEQKTKILVFVYLVGGADEEEKYMNRVKILLTIAVSSCRKCDAALVNR